MDTHKSDDAINKLKRVLPSTKGWIRKEVAYDLPLFEAEKAEKCKVADVHAMSQEIYGPGENQKAESVRQDDGREFTKEARRIVEGEFGRKIEVIHEACDRLDAQQQEIERLKEEIPKRTKLHNSTREHERLLVHEITRLTADLKAKEARIVELELVLEKAAPLVRNQFNSDDIGPKSLPGIIEEGKPK